MTAREPLQHTYVPGLGCLFTVCVLTVTVWTVLKVISFFLQVLKAGNGLSLDMVPGTSQILLIDPQRSWKLVFRSSQDSFRFLAIYCACNGTFPSTIDHETCVYI